MIELSQKPAHERAPRPYLAVVLVAGVLAVGGGVGLAVNQAHSARAAVQAPLAGSDAGSDESGTVTAQEVVATEAAVAPLLPKPAAVRVAEVTAPANPFLPSPAPALPKPVNPGPGNNGQIAALNGQAAPAAPALPKPEPAPAAPSLDDVQLSGIVHGEPPLAVLKYQGQSLFLKIGDQVADTWRLTEIKERSAVFQLGGRRIEIQIQGGSSQ